MRVLVTGGSGVVGQATVTALVERGHTVRLLSRRAQRDARQWPEAVEPWPGDVSDAASLRGSAEGCDAVVHVAGVVDESPPEVTFEKVNVQGTRHVVVEAERAGVPRLVFVSSLGAERGASEYHRSKRRAEQIVRGYRGNWTIARPGNVYGPGDGEISLVLKMVRTLPAIPLFGGGDQPFQPVWHEDVGEALARAVERDDLNGYILEIAGPETTTQQDLVRRFAEITGRSAPTLPVPEFLASLGTRLASMLRLDVPLNEGQLTMIGEGNVIAPDRENALTAVLGVEPTPLDRGLRALADAQPELLPSEGIGGLKRKRFWADISGSRYSTSELFERFRARFAQLLPIDAAAEPGTPAALEPGATLTLRLPVRGHIQVRCEEVADNRVTVATLEGHPLAGAVRFLFEARGPRTRFEIQVYDRAATLADLVIMRTVGDALQDANWVATVERVVSDSGGSAPEGVQRDAETLSEEQATLVEQWLEDLVLARKREANGPVEGTIREAGSEASL